MTAALCIDLGGTRLRAALAEAGREGEAAELGDWPAPADLKNFRHRVAGLIEARGASHVGVAVPGLAAGSACVWAPNLPYLDGQDFSLLFPDVTVALGNDAQLALLAEAALGAAQNAADVILLAIGTGIGSAVLSDGRIVHGARGAAASSWPGLRRSQRSRVTKRSGWLERSASGSALDDAARSAALANGRALIAAARGGNSAALNALTKPSAALGAALALWLCLAAGP